MNKKPRKLIWLAAILLMLVWLSPVLVQAGTVCPAPTVNLEVGIQGNAQVTSGITDYIQKIYLFATAIVGGLAVVMIIIGAVQYSTSAGNKAALGSAKETITSAIIGLVIVLMAYLILGTFSGSFVNLANPCLEGISVPQTGCSWMTSPCTGNYKPEADTSKCGDKPTGTGTYNCCCHRGTYVACEGATGQTQTCQPLTGYMDDDPACVGKPTGTFCGAPGTSCAAFTTAPTCNGAPRPASCEWCDGPLFCTAKGCFDSPADCSTKRGSCCGPLRLQYCQASMECQRNRESDACKAEIANYSSHNNCAACGGGAELVDQNGVVICCKEWHQ